MRFLGLISFNLAGHRIQVLKISYKVLRSFESLLHGADIFSKLWFTPKPFVALAC